MSNVGLYTVLKLQYTDKRNHHPELLRKEKHPGVSLSGITEETAGKTCCDLIKNLRETSPDLAKVQGVKGRGVEIFHSTLWKLLASHSIQVYLGLEPK